MTPKEKANELVNKFNKYTVQQLLYNKNNKTVQYFGDAKECALIAVNEMIEIRNEIINTLKLGALDVA
jgi:hypothetical protein